MLYRAKNGTLPMGDTVMDYIRFGTGRRILVMLPGLGDGLRSVKGMALPMAVLYRSFARDFTVYAFSRRRELSPGCTTRDMARDLKDALDALGIEKAHLFGVSMGGMICQHFAADYPHRVERLILAVTAPCTNPMLEDSVTGWIRMARRGDHTALMRSNLERIYSREYCRKNRWLVPLLGIFTKPRCYQRFLLQAQACLTHDARAQLSRITARTLVIGAEKDLTLGCQPSRDLAAGIPGAQLKIYPHWGHGVYEEAPDFNDIVRSFLLD